MTDIVSHRGGALLWPENSRVAFENTAKLPVEQVEFDVHFSADGQLVVIHDATLDRTTDGTGPVVARSWAELSRLVLRGTGGQRMLLLDEVIELFRPTSIGLRIEIKPGPGRVPYPDLPRRVMETLRDQHMLERCVITSFQLGTVCEAVSFAMPRTHAWLVNPDLQTDLGLSAVCAAARTRGVPMLGLRSSKLDAEAASTVRASGLEIGGWACNDADTIVRMFELNVAGFTTDRPDLALQLRSQNHQEDRR
jgi:glycerophosphoryl diester phosphodiesterase